jgi:hypothetical protein
MFSSQISRFLIPESLPSKTLCYQNRGITHLSYNRSDRSQRRKTKKRRKGYYCCNFFTINILRFLHPIEFQGLYSFMKPEIKYLYVSKSSITSTSHIGITIHRKNHLCNYICQYIPPAVLLPRKSAYVWLKSHENAHSHVQSAETGRRLPLRDLPCPVTAP